MILFNFKILDWKVKIILIIKEYDIEFILTELYNLGCTSLLAKEAYFNISKTKYNTGFTFSNYNTKQSLLLIGKHRIKSLFLNTIVHESRHLQLHISNLKGLDENSEDVCYLIGNIALKIFSKCIDLNII